MHEPGIEFGGFRLDLVTRQLFAPGGDVLPLTGRAFEVLAYLAQHRDRVVGRDELLASVWTGRVVEENNLTQAIAALRRAFGTDANDHRFILTVTGRGYRFVAQIDGEAVSGQASGSASAPAQALKSSPTAPASWNRLWLPAAAASALALLVVAGGWAWRRASTPPVPESALQAPGSTTAAPARLAVLPFRPISAGEGDAMLELGMAETLITGLGRTAGLQVLSLGAVEPFLGKVVEPLRTGRALGAAYVVEGSTQRRGDAIRVNVRLLAVADGRSLWSGTFDAPPDRVFTLQDAIAKAVSAALVVQRAPSRSAYTSPCDGEDALAYRAYLRGRHMMFRPDPVGLPKAMEAFDEAIARDPACARAWAGKAFALRSLAMVADRDPRSTFPLARAAVEQALRLDPGSAEAYASRGVIQFWFDWDWAGAEASLRHAIALDPNLAEAHYALAHLLHNIGRNEEGLPHAAHAATLNPLSPLINTIGASFLIPAGRVQEAERRLDAVLDLDPGFWAALFWKSRLRARRGEAEGAMVDMQRAAEACRRCSHALAGLAWLQAKNGNADAAAATLLEMERRRAQGYFPATRIALAQLALGRSDQAMSELERAYDERDLYLTFLGIDEYLQDLRDHPRFHALLAKMHLEGEGQPTNR